MKVFLFRDDPIQLVALGIGFLILVVGVCSRQSLVGATGLILAIVLPIAVGLNSKWRPA